MADKQYTAILALKDKVSPILKGIESRARLTNRNLGKFQARVEKIGRQTANIRKLGESFRNAGGKITATTAKIGASLLAVGGATVVAFNKVADMGDRIDKMSQKIGMSRKAFQEWDYIMSQNGGNVESLQMGFKTLTTQIEGVQKGSKDSKAAFDALGVAVKQSNGQFRSQEDIFNDTIRELQLIKDPTRKAMLANRLFGRSAAELKPLLNQEAEAIDNLRKKANEMGLVLTDEQINNAVKFKDTMDTVTRVFQAKFGGIIMNLMPKFTEILDKILARREIIAKFIGIIGKVADVILRVADWFMGLSKEGKIAIGIIIGFINGLGPLLTTIGSIMLIVANAPAAIAAITAAVGTLNAALLPEIAIIAGIAAAFWGLLKGIEAVTKAITKLKGQKLGGDSLNLKSTKVLEYLSKKREEVGADEFNKMYDRSVQKAIKNYNQKNTTNNNQSYDNRTYNTTNNYSSAFTLGNAQYST